MNNLKIIFVIVFSFLISHFCNAKIVIKYKIDGQIITNVDILNEKNYLIFLRPNLINLSETELLKISKNSLIREIIKKKDIKKIFKDVKRDGLNDDIKKNLFAFKNVKNEREFLNLLKNYNISYEMVLEK